VMANAFPDRDLRDGWPRYASVLPTRNEVPIELIVLGERLE
jgi:hypothetical protein